MSKTLNPWPFPPIHDNVMELNTDSEGPQGDPLDPHNPSNLAENLNMTYEWMNYHQSMSSTLTTNFTPTGYIVPAITTETANQIAADKVQGMAYNSEEQSMQLNNDGVWENILTMLPLSSSEIATFQPSNSIKIHLLYNTDTDEIVVVRGPTSFTLEKV